MHAINLRHTREDAAAIMHELKMAGNQKLDARRMHQIHEAFLRRAESKTHPLPFGYDYELARHFLFRHLVHQLAAEHHIRLTERQLAPLRGLSGRRYYHGTHSARVLEDSERAAKALGKLGPTGERIFSALKEEAKELREMHYGNPPTAGHSEHGHRDMFINPINNFILLASLGENVPELLESIRNLKESMKARGKD
ncbi:hypothetical protein HY095_00550 [Candidatus Micrarchaeota archaeon]|nr:hypothetical protein [Candidatus Micrarchaeota archaeon]